MRNKKLLPWPWMLTFFTLLLAPVDSTDQPPFSCDPSDPSTSSYIFCKATLPIIQRARDLVCRLTLDEKISQLVSSAPPIPRLGIPGYEWWSEALHGVANVGRGIRFNGNIKAATSFPQVILTAASFDAYQWYRIGLAIGKEARGIYNAGQAEGMTFWAPNINIFRDPRWGRGQETPGEDPLVTGKYAVSYVRGVQGDAFEGGKLQGHLQASACCKHFTAYDLDNWKGVNRFVFDARVTMQDLADTYQPPFQSCIQKARASGIMCAYNRVNGVPSCADYNLLSNIARRQWDFHGYIASDCDAVSIIHDDQGYAKSPEDAVVDVLKAGMDVNCGSYLQKHARSAVDQNKLPESEIDRALHNLFSVRMRLGLFNGNPSAQPFGNIGPDQVCSQEHQILALEAARNGIVLLKNSAKLLPLSKSKTMSLAVIGPNANSGQTLLGNYAGPPCKFVTPLQALQGYVKDTVYHPGCDTVQCSSAAIDKAVDIAKSADFVVLIMGLDQTQEREELDRVDLVLPGMQQNLITSVAKAAKEPIVLVLICGGPVDVSFAKHDIKIGSILWAGYPGEAGGIALAEIIFGDHNPGGRLPMTWYPQEFVKVPMTDMRMRPEPSSDYPGRTHRFYTGDSVFEFGHGLSYSKYTYEFKSVSKSTLYLNQSLATYKIDKSDSVRYLSVSELGTEFCEKQKFPVFIGVENHGDMAGKHPVLVFARQAKHGNGRPRKQLVGFKSVILSPGERAEIEVELSPCEHLSRANEDGLMVMEEGTHFLATGGDEHPISIIV
ncbi:putative Periplasmic beta-glucosidase precursor [Tripterygium wilfordii]|uniref:Putative Periplasmic beta-glucosidase n=1 Tax=Tripterygium wilfordii TaxID=458696 RepID=A0A7J7DKB8_TRIWF|nr:probable beta-D-xylosidase 7 [Tripterygium wilfordii]KAF5746810.1 putative Periplasmic beta-glucosidase precursor [Tripterygium wilfordii]